MEQYAQNIMCTDEEKVITYCKNIIKPELFTEQYLN